MNLSNVILQFNFYFIAFANYLNRTSIAPRMGISSTQRTDMNTALADYATKITTYSSPDTHNSGTTNDMIISFKDAYLLVESYKTQIESNSIVVLTGTDRNNLGIAVPVSRRSRIPVPTIRPAVLCVFITNLMMKFICFDPTNPFRRAKPKDVWSIGVKIAITGVDSPEPRLEEYQKLDPEKNTEFEMLFTADQVGKKLYIICYYLNNRGEAGPDSLPFSVTII